MKRKPLPEKQLVWIAVAVLTCSSVPPATGASWMLSGNENKIDLASGTAQVVSDAQPDTLTILDFSQFPPAVQHLTHVPNTVIGPPSNIALSPSAPLALIANSVKLDPTNPTGYSPQSQIHILDLSSNPPKILGQVHAGPQPSGLSFTPDGRLALVANRAGGSVSVLRIQDTQVTLAQTLPVCPQEDSASDVAIHPNGQLALVSIQKGGYLQVLEIQDDQIRMTDRKISVYGQPYRCAITPDGALGLTAGQGTGNGLDDDALTVVDLQARPMRTVDYVPLGPVPESFEISPDGQLVAAVIMNGSNLAPSHPNYHAHGAVVLLERRDRTFRKVQSLPVGRIPEGVAFSSDGRHLVVQCHPERELWVLAVQDHRLHDTGLRLPVPGMPSSLRAAP